MNPPTDPSGAARAPQPLAELLAEVRGALVGTFSSDPNVCFPAVSAIEKNAPEWLGALVQAVEDQQRELEKWKPREIALDHRITGLTVGDDVSIQGDHVSGKRFVMIPVGEYEVATAKAQRALDEVAQLRADGQRLTEEVARLVRVLDDFAHAAHAVLEGDSYVGTTPEMVAANRHRLAVLAGKWDRPVTARGQ